MNMPKKHQRYNAYAFLLGLITMHYAEPQSLRHMLLAAFFTLVTIAYAICLDFTHEMEAKQKEVQSE